MYILKKLEELDSYLRAMKGVDGKDKAEEALEAVHRFYLLFQDGLTWEEIKQHLEKGCKCPQIKSKKEFERLGG